MDGFKVGMAVGNVGIIVVGIIVGTAVGALVGPEVIAIFVIIAFADGNQGSAAKTMTLGQGIRPEGNAIGPKLKAEGPVIATLIAKSRIVIATVLCPELEIAGDVESVK